LAQAVVNLSYIGNGPSGSGQVIADQTSGPKSKTLYAYGTLVASSGTFVTETAAAVNFIDGTSTLASKPAFVNVFLAGSSGDSSGAAAALSSGMYPSALSNTGFTLNHANLTTTGAQATIGVIIGFSS